jgi:dTDP-4-dehydrorhamnose 3,5-epimerase
VIKGSVLDIAVDIRRSSSTFGQHVAAELTVDNKHQLFIPCGFAHGFVVLSDSAIFSYKVDNYYAPKHDRGIIFNDKDLAIDWQLSLEELKLSDKDKTQPTLSNAQDLFE